MTREEIFEAVRALAVRPNLADSLLSVAVQNVESELNRELRDHPRNQYRATWEMPFGAPLSDIVPLPTDMSLLIDFREVGGKVLTSRPPTYVPLDKNEAYYVLKGNVLQVFPFPSDHLTYLIDCIGFIAPLVGTDTNWVSTYFPDLYIYGTLKETAILTKKDERFVLWQSEFLRRLDGVKKQGWDQNVGATPVRTR